MSSSGRKTSDLEIVGLNSVGLSLGGIAKRLRVHHTTVTHRLKILNIEPADTRRAFMEDIYEGLSPQQQSWLIDELGPGHSIKDFIRSLIIEKYISKNS